MAYFSAAVRMAAALSLCLVAGASHAISILHFEDAALGSSAVSGALDALGLSGSTTFTDDVGSVNALLGTHSYDLVIFGEQNVGSFAAVSGALGMHLADGGKVLGTTYRIDGFQAFMGAAFATDANDATLVTDGHALFDGLGPVLDLTNPGWGVFSRGWAATAGASELGSLAGGAAGILGNGGNTLLLGPLFDTFASLDEGERLLANAIGLLLGDVQSVPEPSMLGLTALGLMAVVLHRRRQRG